MCCCLKIVRRIFLAPIGDAVAHNILLLKFDSTSNQGVLYFLLFTPWFPYINN